MNNTRRAALKKAMEALQDIKSDIENLRDEEDEYLNNMPESLQGGEKGEKAQEAVDSLERVIDLIDEAVENIESASE